MRCCYPGLLPVDHVAAVLPLRATGEVADVRAGLRLRHRDRLHTSARDAAEDLLLLLIGPEPLERTRGDHADRVERHRDLPAGELLAKETQIDSTAARAAVLLGNRDPEPAEIGDPLVNPT